MFHKNLNKVQITGHHNTVIQFIDTEGQLLEEKTLEVFLAPYTKALKEQIELLQKNLLDKQRIDAYQQQEILTLSEQINQLQAEKDKKEQQTIQLLHEIVDKDLSQTASIYQIAFELFSEGNVSQALSILEEQQLDVLEQEALNATKKVVETRLLKARLLVVDDQYPAADIQYQKAADLAKDWATYMEAANYFYQQHHFAQAKVYYQYCVALSSSLDQKSWTLNNLAVLLKAENDLELAKKHYQEALEIRRQLALKKPTAFLPDVAMTLNNLAVLLSNENDLELAKKHYQEALEIYRQLALKNPTAFLPDVAMTLINQGVFYLQSEVDQAASLGAAQEAIHLLIPFCHIGYIQNYLTTALQILTHWGVDAEAYLQADRDAYKNDSSNAL